MRFGQCGLHCLAIFTLLSKVPLSQGTKQDCESKHLMSRKPRPCVRGIQEGDTVEKETS